MKTLSGPLKPIAVTLGILSIVTLVVFAEDSKGRVIFEQNAVLIPGTHISPADQKDLNDILKKYDKSLYKIEIYKKGRVVKTEGTLKDVILRHTRAAQFATDSRKSALSGWALQIGLDIEENNPTPPPMPKHSGSSEELVARVTKILSKYARK